MIKFIDRRIERTSSTFEGLPQMVEFQLEYPVSITKPLLLAEKDYIDDLQTLRQNPPGVSVKVNIGTPQLETPSKLPYVLDESMQKHKGRMKFYDESKKYGFLILDDDGTDVFVHQDDLLIAGFPLEVMKTYKVAQQNNPLYVKFLKNGGPYFEFTLMNYMGKYNKSRKAINLQLIN